jgi:putative flippase GtrA
MTTVDRQPLRQPSTTPTSKVAAGGTAGAVTVVLVYILNKFHLDVPGEVGSALTVILSFVTSYFIKDRGTVDAVTDPASAG